MILFLSEIKTLVMRLGKIQLLEIKCPFAILLYEAYFALTMQPTFS
uniref:Uncharacterized protein n=2 Tax=Picea TaxID=3328 RepID=A0A101LZL0_PICGL|nr:hypothetical protein ABT39_MTgene5163 [Picea glauca]QHR91649.1 hypothetical protein Q903MT_gene5685 [Picea sitchensis]